MGTHLTSAGITAGKIQLLSGEAASKSPGTGEQILSGGDERGAVFTHRGRHRGHLSGSLTQGVFTSTPWDRTHHGIVFIFIFSEDKVCFEVGF